MLTRFIHKLINLYVLIRYNKVSQQFRHFYRLTYYCQWKQIQYFYHDYLSRKKYKDISFHGEFGAELQFALPFAYWHYKNGTLKRTNSSKFTKELYFFSEDHSECFTERTDEGNYSCEFPRIVYSQNYDMSKWAQVPLKEIYRNDVYVYDKPILIIANRYNTEWDRQPVSYLSIPVLSFIIENLKNKYTIIYNRPRPENIIGDNSKILDLNEYLWLKDTHPDVILMHELYAENRAGAENFNHLQMMVYANSEHFISTHGGTSVLASYFGGINLILSKEGPEHHFDCYQKLYPKLSNARIFHAKDEETLERYIRQLFIEPVTTRLNINILGDYKPGAPDGLTEFTYQNYLLLKDIFFIQFIEFDDHRNETYYEFEIRDGVSIHRFGSENTPPYKLSHSFRSWLRNLPIANSVFHLNHIYNLSNYLVAKQLKEIGIPYLITPHDSYVYGAKYKSEHMSWLKRFYRVLYVNVIDKYVLNNASVVHALTPQCTESLSPITESSIIEVGNQVREIKSTFDFSTIKQQLCFIGRFHIAQKGIDIALKAFQLFLDKSPSLQDVKFVLVGPANSEEQLMTKKILAQFGHKISENISLTGKVSESKRDKILIESKAYIQLSRSEGFGLSVIQALSAYKPVIISYQIPISNKIIADNAGFVVKDEFEAAEALEKIFTMPQSDYLKLAMNARRCYETHFHPDAVKPLLIDLYRKTAGL